MMITLPRPDLQCSGQRTTVTGDLLHFPGATSQCAFEALKTPYETSYAVKICILPGKNNHDFPWTLNRVHSAQIFKNLQPRQTAHVLATGLTFPPSEGRGAYWDFLCPPLHF